MITIIYRFLPMRVIHFFRKIKNIIFRRSILCLSNGRFKDTFKGKRCFILCNGSSVNKQNLIPLKNEIVFSVSNGYYHKDYNIIKPKYHCVPGISYSSYFSVKDAIAWFREMDQGIGDAELFLDIAEEPLVRKNSLFNGRTVNYICMAAPFTARFTKKIDISKITPACQSVSIMCLMTAIYMGFNEIYLIGTEHDADITGEYKYFYSQYHQSIKNSDVNPDGKINNLRLTRQATKKLMWQYAILNNIAKNQSINIYNATIGGALKIFPRVNLDEISRISA